MFHDDELEESEKFYVGQPRVLLLIYALYNTLVARSEMVCYFVIILNHMISASMITLVLPILIFLWAMLSVPRPSKRFWMTAIVYTEVCCWFCNPMSSTENLSCELCTMSFLVLISRIRGLCSFILIEIFAKVLGNFCGIKWSCLCSIHCNEE